ncbi:MAG: hypothetical protein RL693_355 [Verrucomicrobiota bacterium]|jgi:hypothetical protein
MKHLAHPDFWVYYHQLPSHIYELADKNFQLMKESPRHPSVRLKKVGILWSARVGLHYRALAKEESDVLVWFWIGHHADYDKYLN